jgi:hypothetical protein
VNASNLKTAAIAVIMAADDEYDNGRNALCR